LCLFLVTYGYQTEYLHKKNTLLLLTRKKSIRLLLPSFIFGLAYLFVFDTGKGNFLVIIWNSINGTAHLWFLPMLFWCFIFEWIISKIRIPQIIILALLLILNYTSYRFESFPFQLSKSFSYLLFFHLGYIVACKIDIFRLHVKMWNTFIVVFFFFLFFVLFQLNEDLLPYKITKLLYIVQQIWGVFTLYMLSMIHAQRHVVCNTWHSFGVYSMGVYIFHQFFLIGIYYHSVLPICLGYVFLPWFSFVITLALSFLFSWILKKNHLGRQLIWFFHLIQERKEF